MHISVEVFTVNKRFPLTISRGTTAQTTNVWLRVEQDGIEGWGEASPFNLGNHRQCTETIRDTLQQVAPVLKGLVPWNDSELS